MAGRAFDLRAVLHEHAVAIDGDEAGIEALAFFVNRAAERDVNLLPLAGRAQRVGERRAYGYIPQAKPSA